jgi:hypothetical protein
MKFRIAIFALTLIATGAPASAVGNAQDGKDHGVFCKSVRPAHSALRPWGIIYMPCWLPLFG